MEQRETPAPAPLPGELALAAEPGAGASVEELMRALGTAVRSYRLYGGDGPNVERFVEALRERFSAFWAVHPELTLEVEERQLRCDERVVYPLPGADGGGDLAFVFYKDGIRELTLLPGFEAELEPFLSVLARAPLLREDEDDLVTLLWQEDFTCLRYRYVEAAQDGVELPAATGGAPAPVNPETVRAAAAATDSAPAFTPEDFQETLYFLDPAELRRLTDEVRREAERDLWNDVLSALFDRLEDGDAERQTRIVRMLGELLPPMLAAGNLPRAAGMLRELVELASREGLLCADALRQARELFGLLARQDTIVQLVQTLEDSPETVHSEALNQLLGYFPPEALAPLMRVTDQMVRPDVRRRLEQAIQGLAQAHRGHVVQLLDEESPAVLANAVAWVGRLGIGSAAARLVRLLSHPDRAVRLAAIGALQEVRAATAGSTLVNLLEDPEREVRIAAARALGALEFTGARGPLEAALDSKRLRSADRTEKLAFFEAYGRLSGAAGVALLDGILNGKNWLGRGEEPELRACAAAALGRIRHDTARAALAAAARDAEPVVRTAVARALRGEDA